MGESVNSVDHPSWRKTCFITSNLYFHVFYFSIASEFQRKEKKEKKKKEGKKW